MADRKQYPRFTATQLASEHEANPMPIDRAFDEMRPVGLEFGAEILDDAEYRAALAQVAAYFENEPDPESVDGERFQILLRQIEAYEKRLAGDKLASAW